MADKLFDLPDGGYVGRYDANELEIVPGHKDPCKWRFALPQRFVDQGATNLGALSFNIQRSDGRHEEKALIMGRLNGPREAQFGALYVATAPPGSDEVRERFYIDHGQAIFRVPIVAPNIGGGPAVGSRIALRSMANGRIVCAESAGDSALIANRDAVGPWEIFEVIEVP